jgi:hypothetical protein
LSQFISGWKINENLSTGSDHEVITFSINLNLNNYVDIPTSTNKFNWNKADWNKFANTLIELDIANSITWERLLDNNNLNESKLEEATQLLQDKILEAIDLLIPKIQITPRLKIWWNEEINEN